MRVRGLLGPLPDAVRLRATDTAAEWVIGDDPNHVVATINGPAADLLLHLWKRTGDADLTWSGDGDAGRVTLANAVTA